jgi:hypothetical protein
MADETEQVAKIVDQLIENYLCQGNEAMKLFPHVYHL